MNFAQFILSLSSKMEKGIYKIHICALGLFFSLFWIIVVYFHFRVFESTLVSNNTVQNNLISISESPKLDKAVFPFIKAMKTMKNESDPCGGRYVYIHNLPSRFNDDIIKNCGSISKRYDMCKFTTNNGFGPLFNNTEGVFSAKGWYETNHHTLSIIFHNRMKHYESLTSDSSVASAIFVPFYAGFDASRYRAYDISVRDAASNDLIEWLRQRDEWKYMNGKDHFLVSGRVTWYFRRQTDEGSDWGNRFLLSPAAKNMSMLLTESSPWSSNDFAIPYPTYFHPSRDVEVFEWQDRMRKMERKWLFSFVGAPRPGNTKSIRSLVIDQCKNSNVGNLLDCGVDESKCRSPSSVINTFQSSLYCLQPRGDSSARRSAFDSILGGCVPVFFHPRSFYVQYTWHIPQNYTKYSVCIPEDDIRKNISIEKRLSQIDPKTVKMMREEVINMIPRLLYADPDSKLGIEDAIDVALKAIISKVAKLRQDIIDGERDDELI